MTTDVDVQYFSHLNGLVLGNNWGDMIRLLDICLVNGLPLTDITSASIDAQGDILLTTYAAHKCMLFQIIELTGFTPTELNGKYRIKGTPSENQLVLKATHVGKSIANKGAAKLASLGYDIIFRDTNDVKRVYRAKNPRAEHPFIRVDETISDGVNSYNSSYAKSAMVGLIEHMEHIDDFENPDVLQLPFDPADPSKNWKITGTGTSVVRGWSKWYWATNFGTNTSSQESSTPTNGDRIFTICGNNDAFYFMIPARLTNQNTKVTYGCGLFNSAAEYGSESKPWFLMTELTLLAASSNRTLNYNALAIGANQSRFIAPRQSIIGDGAHVHTTPLLINYSSGTINTTPLSDMPVISAAFGDEDGALRGSLKHILTILKAMSPLEAKTSPVVSGSSLYVVDTVGLSSVSHGYFAFYLGEAE